jgi:anti-sigma factor RsiW
MGDGQKFSDEELMAYADGELPASERARVQAAVKSDPALAARVEVFARTRERLSGAYGEVLREPPPPRLLEAIGALPPEGRPANDNARAGSLRLAAMAAALAGVAAGLVGYAAGTRQRERATLLEALGSQGPRLAAFIGGAADGAARPLDRDSRVTVRASHRLRDGRLCRSLVAEREGEREALEILACAAGGGWRVEVVARALPDGGGWRPAGGGDALDAVLEAAGASPPLSPTEIDALIRRGWREGP